MATRVALVERDVDYLKRRIDDHLVTAKETNERLVDAIEKLDSRTDALTMRVSVAFGIVGAGWTIIQVLPPVIRDVLRIPAG